MCACARSCVPSVRHLWCMMLDDACSSFGMSVVYVVLNMGTYSHNKQGLWQRSLLFGLYVYAYVSNNGCCSIYTHTHIYIIHIRTYVHMRVFLRLNTLLLQGVPMIREPAVSSAAGRRCATAVLASCAVGAVLAPEAHCNLYRGLNN